MTMTMQEATSGITVTQINQAHMKKYKSVPKKAAKGDKNKSQHSKEELERELDKEQALL